MTRDPAGTPDHVPLRLLLALPLLALSFIGADAIQAGSVEASIDFGSVDVKLVEQPSSALDVAQDTNFGHQLSGLGDFNEDGSAEMVLLQTPTVNVEYMVFETGCPPVTVKAHYEVI